jgi:ATP-dependent Clp protease ATP-binding subunit ClpA
VPAKTTTITARTRKPSHELVDDLHARLTEKVVGQSAAIESIVPYVQIYQAGLGPEGRPVGVFLLLGPTGTGKTRTVEALAEVLHGNAKNMLKVDCGEFQMEHEVAKLIGAPPGYLGHRETQPLLTQMKLTAAASERSSLSIVLFDEIEKAAPSMTRLLLGILDKATLRLGDNTCVNFESSMIFMTSNLGARGMLRELSPSFGFESGVPRETGDRSRQLGRIAQDAVRKNFSPEFVNRIDAVVTYQPLGGEELAAILDQHLDELQRHIVARLGQRGFELRVDDECRRQLLRQGTSLEYGARELKRTIHRRLTQPLAVMLSRGEIEAGACVSVQYDEPLDEFRFRTGKASACAAA